jgi:hypothetical protein
MPAQTVREMLFAKIDELVATFACDLDEFRGGTEQLEPEWARSGQ